MQVGDAFGERGLRSGVPACATVLTREHTDLLVLPAEHYNRLIRPESYVPQPEKLRLTLLKAVSYTHLRAHETGAYL
eukprot:3010404-Pyramimonas_sp.AAC.1